MKNKQINQLLSVGAGNNKLNSLRKIELPYFMRIDENRLASNQLSVFTTGDAVKVIEHIINKGLRFSNLKKSVNTN
jgi:hypothetical protein